MVLPHVTQYPKSGKFPWVFRLISSLLPGVLLFFLAAGSGRATSFSGIFGEDDDVALFNFVANTAELVTIETSSYASGGFAPTGFLFDGLGDVLTLTNGTCGQVGQDSTTLNCDDLYFQDTIGPGSFTLALAVYNNTPVGTLPGDGFTEDGQPGFTCTEAGATGSFCDLTTIFGTSRTGNYDLSITESSVPEPGSAVLLLSGGAAVVLLRRRRFKRGTR